MKRIVIVGLAATVLACTASLAQARTDVVFSVELGNSQPVYVQPQPVYVQPQPVYVQPRGYYDGHGRWVQVSPAPAYVLPAPAYGYGYEYDRRLREEREWRRAQWRRHHRHHDVEEFYGDRRWD
ncbi:hypothetical protein [Ramlibacter sp.]|uniref:hypothetical protein n=1 Tax=Ramlibacter sp. TaxID=1917967 RepID=UPI00182C67AA|nr:hypothetical protein [Ramlibacter sp.]MBA2675737.1 PXPV repeat protein [Ramlibacter sp.]